MECHVNVCFPKRLLTATVPVICRDTLLETALLDNMQSFD
jgi:hypothetical protein